MSSKSAKAVMRKIVAGNSEKKLESFMKSPLLREHVMEQCDVCLEELLKLNQLKAAYNEARDLVTNKLPPGVHLNETAHAEHRIVVSSYWGEPPAIVKALEPYKEIQEERITFNEMIESFRTNKEALDWAKENEPDVYRETLARL